MKFSSNISIAMLFNLLHFVNGPSFHIAEMLPFSSASEDSCWIRINGVWDLLNVLNIICDHYHTFKTKHSESWIKLKRFELYILLSVSILNWRRPLVILSIDNSWLASSPFKWRLTARLICLTDNSKHSFLVSSKYPGPSASGS